MGKFSLTQNKLFSVAEEEWLFGNSWNLGKGSFYKLMSDCL